jgi:beta-glucosidase
LTALAGSPELRLLGWDKVALAPGESRHVTVTVDRRLLARFDEKAHVWRIPAGRYSLALGTSSADLGPRAEVTLSAASFKP